MKWRLSRPSPAMVVAMLALLVALSGTAVAAGVVPLAKRALSADNAKKLQGKSALQIAAAAAEAGSLLPGPASTIAHLVDVHPGTFSLPAGDSTTTPSQVFQVACPSGEKAITGGYSSLADVQGADETISPDGGTWSVLVINLDDVAANGSLYVVCLK